MQNRLWISSYNISLLLRLLTNLSFQTFSLLNEKVLHVHKVIYLLVVMCLNIADGIPSCMSGTTHVSLNEQQSCVNSYLSG